MSKFVNQEIDPEHVWINISKGKLVKAAVLVSIYTGRYNNLVRGVYKLEDEAVRSVNEMIRLAKEGENIRFYIIEEAKEDNNDVAG